MTPPLDNNFINCPLSYFLTFFHTQLKLTTFFFFFGPVKTRYTNLHIYIGLHILPAAGDYTPQPPTQIRPNPPKSYPETHGTFFKRTFSPEDAHIALYFSSFSHIFIYVTLCIIHTSWDPLSSNTTFHTFTHYTQATGLTEGELRGSGTRTAGVKTDPHSLLLKS